jgi:hypothetical protein
MEFTDKELKALKTEYAANATDAQFDFWIETCKRRNLVPVEDIVLQVRSVKEYDEDAKAKIYKSKVIFITTIRALLKKAEATKKYRGFVPSEYIYLDSEGLPNTVSQIPLPDPTKKDKPLTPWAARVGVRREGFDDPQYTITRFWAYAQSYKDSEGNRVLNDTWKTRGPEQLVKCAKAAALREAFPDELGGLYLHEEFQDDDDTPKAGSGRTATDPVAPTVAPPATVAPPVNQVPAEGKVAPRPGEKKEDLPGYTPPLTLEDKLEFERNAHKALNAASAPTVFAASAGPNDPNGGPLGVAGPNDPRGNEPATEADKKADVKGGGKRPKTKKETAKTSATPATESATKAPESPDSSLDEIKERAKREAEGKLTKVDILDANRLPTKAEFSEILTKIVAFRDRVGGAGSEGSQQLRTYILTKSKKADTKEVLVQEWLDIFKTLSDALDDNDLKSIIAKS